MNYKSGVVLRIVVLTLVMVSLVCASDTFAQKKKKGKKGQSEVIEPKVITPTDRLLSETYLVDGDKYYTLEEFSKAFVMYQKALEYDPANGAAHFKIAQIYARNSELDKAAEHSSKALALDDSNKYYYLQLADIYTKLNELEKASALYEKMISSISGTNEYLFELAALYIYQKNYDKALDTYGRVEDLYGISPEVIVQKQKLYLQQSKLDEAINEGKRLIEAFPDEDRYKLALAKVMISNNRIEQAMPYLEQILKDQPENAEAIVILADVYNKLGKHEEARALQLKAFGISEFDLSQKLRIIGPMLSQLPNDDVEALLHEYRKAILKAHPNDVDAYAVNGDILVRTGNDEEAYTMFLKALQMDDSNYSLWQNILQLELRMEKYDSVMMRGDKAVELFPNQPVIYYFLGTALLIKKKNKEAVEILESGATLSGENKDLKGIFLAQLGDVYNNLENYEKSDNAYDKALVIDPDNYHVLNNYSYFLSLRKANLDRALKMSTKLVEANPDDPTYLDTHAWVLYMLGEYKEARIHIEKAVKTDDVSGTILEHYGDILFKLGDVDGAVMQWEKAKTLEETSDLIDKKIADRKLYE